MTMVCRPRTLSRSTRFHSHFLRRPQIGSRITKEGGMADRILPTETQAPASAPTPHAYNDPDLEPIEFLQAVYHATHLPMSIRIDAARALLPFTEPRPASIPSSRIGCTIVIGGLGPYDHGLSAEDPEQINTISQSFSSSASNREPHNQRGWHGRQNSTHRDPGSCLCSHAPCL